MISFWDELDSAVKESARGSASESVEHWSREVLKEFALWINDRYKGAIYASVREEELFPELTRLYISPSNRLDETIPLLVIQGAGERAIALGPDQQMFSTADELREYIKERVKAPVFTQTLDELTSRNSDPVEAYLRAGYPRDKDPKYDVFVVVSPEHQARIAQAFQDNDTARIEALKIRAIGQSPIAQGKLSERINQAKWLVSGGVVVRIESTSLLDEDSAELTGSVCLDE